MFADGTLYTVRPNTSFVVSARRRLRRPEQLDRDGVRLGQPQHRAAARRGSRPRAPRRGCTRSRRPSSPTSQAPSARPLRRPAGRARGRGRRRRRREVGELEQVVQTGDRLARAAPAARAHRSRSRRPTTSRSSAERTPELVLELGAGAGGGALRPPGLAQSRLFVDNVIDVANRPDPRATLGLRGEGSFQWRVAALDRGRRARAVERAAAASASRCRPLAAGRRSTAPRAPIARRRCSSSSRRQALRQYLHRPPAAPKPGATVEINGEPASVAADGSFTKTVQLDQEGLELHRGPGARRLGQPRPPGASGLRGACPRPGSERKLACLSPRSCVTSRTTWRSTSAPPTPWSSRATRASWCASPRWW